MDNPRERAAAIVIRYGKVLLIARWNVDKGDYFIFPGGGIEPGETPQQAVVRELREEAGVTITSVRLFHEIKNLHPYGNQFYFLADLVANQQPEWQEGFKQSTSDHYAFQWVKGDHIAMIDLLPYEIRDKLAVKLTNNNSSL